MIRTSIITAILIMLNSIISLSSPKLVLDCGTTYDWGDVNQKDSPLKADIKIFNEGDDTLKINRVNPMCGCTTAPLSKKSIAPGDSAILKVTLNIKHYEGDVTKSIIISSNSRSPELHLKLKANVHIPLKLFPNKYMNFSQMYIGNPTTSKIVIDNMTDHDIMITGVKLDNQDISLNMKEGDIIQDTLQQELK